MYQVPTRRRAGLEWLREQRRDQLASVGEAVAAEQLLLKFALCRHRFNRSAVVLQVMHGKVSPHLRLATGMHYHPGIAMRHGPRFQWIDVRFE
jgi:hypothetical protein